MTAETTPFRRTKIIFTLGPASESEAMLEQLIRAGADIVRLNMAHAKHDWTRDVVRRIRAVSARVGRDVAIMMDIKGPEIRTGDVVAPIPLRRGEDFDFVLKPGAPRDPHDPTRSVDVNYRNLANDVEVGDILLVDSGLIRLQVRQKHDTHLRCRVLTAGTLGSRRHINLPGIRVGLPSFTEKDRADTLVGIEEGIDFLALSFVREAADITQLRDFLKRHGSEARIIAKIEDQSAIENLEEIIRATDILMVARGDLGIEVPLEELPIIQHRAVGICRTVGRPVIIATHMLESMTSQPVPTRAEITDVANAVYERADCVMLSGETTVGKYPFECVRVLDSIARRVERELAAEPPEPVVLADPQMKFMRAAVIMATEFPGSRIVIFTRQGRSASCLAAHRPDRTPILALTDSVTTLRQMHIIRSVEPHLIEIHGDPEKTLTRALGALLAADRIQLGETLIVISDVVTSGAERVESIQMRTVGPAPTV